MKRTKTYRGEEAETLSTAELARIRANLDARFAGCSTAEELEAEFCVPAPTRKVRVVVVA